MLDIYKEKAELAQSSQFQRIRQFQLEEILSVSNSKIEPAEIRGMLKLIKRTDDWVRDYETMLQRLDREN